LAGKSELAKNQRKKLFLSSPNHSDLHVRRRVGLRGDERRTWELSERKEKTDLPERGPTKKPAGFERGEKRIPPLTGFG